MRVSIRVFKEFNSVVVVYMHIEIQIFTMTEESIMIFAENRYSCTADLLSL